MRRTPSIPLLLTLLSLSPRAAAQDPVQVPDLYHAARAQLAAGDTVAGLQSLRRLTVDAPDFAPGWGLLGLTLTLRASSVETDYRERREAQTALQRALKLVPDNPLYLFSLGLLRRKQRMTPDSERLMRRAISALEQQPDRLTPLELDEFVLLRRMLALNEARQAQREFESLRRASLPRRTERLGCFERVGRICLAWEATNTPADAASRLSVARDSMIEVFTDANKSIPGGDGWIVGQLVRYLVEAGRLDSAHAVADNCGALAPWWCSALLGYVYHVTGRYEMADSAFGRALDGMREGSRRLWTDISLLLPTEARQAYADLADSQRDSLERRFWWLSVPLYLTPTNDRRTEHLARVVLDQLQVDAASGFAAAWGPDFQEVLMRYGWPRGWLTVRPRRGGWRIVAYYLDRARSFVPPSSYVSFPTPSSAQFPTAPWPLDPRAARTTYAPGYATFRNLEHQIGLFQRATRSRW